MTATLLDPYAPGGVAPASLLAVPNGEMEIQVRSDGYTVCRANRYGTRLTYQSSTRNGEVLQDLHTVALLCHAYALSHAQHRRVVIDVIAGFGGADRTFSGRKRTPYANASVTEHDDEVQCEQMVKGIETLCRWFLDRHLRTKAGSAGFSFTVSPDDCGTRETLTTRAFFGSHPSATGNVELA